jgi:hypothetical protein
MPFVAIRTPDAKPCRPPSSSKTDRHRRLARPASETKERFTKRMARGRRSISKQISSLPFPHAMARTAPKNDPLAGIRPRSHPALFPGHPSFGRRDSLLERMKAGLRQPFNEIGGPASRCPDKSALILPIQTPAPWLEAIERADPRNERAGMPGTREFLPLEEPKPASSFPFLKPAGCLEGQ